MKSLTQHIQENLQVNESFDTVIDITAMDKTEIEKLHKILSDNKIKISEKKNEISLDWFKLDRKLKMEIEELKNIIFEH